MTESTVSNDDLLAYLDELLPVERMADIERHLRSSKRLQQHAAELARRRDQGAHSVGAIWRRGRLSCPTRGQLGSYLLGALDDAMYDYVTFHLQTIGCRFCAANLQDLEHASQNQPEQAQRRQRYFQSSAGQLRREE